MNNELSILIGADIVPTQSNYELFSSAQIEKLIGNEISNILNNHDFRIFNLETPLTNNLNPIKKSGPILDAPEETIEGIKSINPSLLVLSNNHILDHSDIGIENTIKLLNSKNINYIGIGKTLEERNKTFIFEKNNIKIGIYNCCEHEFSITKEGQWGANPYDPLISFDIVYELKQKCNYVIVLYHGGKEFYRYPSPQLAKVFRKFSDKGADVVIAQHTHCIGSFELYNNSLLLYGQGNFIFDDNDYEYQEYLNSGLLVSLTFSLEKIDYNFIPIIKEKNHITLATETEKNIILESFNKRSNNIKSISFLENEYKLFSEKAIKGYLLNLHIGTKLDTILIRLLLKNKKTNKKIYNKLLNIKNYLDCEAHSELLKEGIDNILNV